MKSLNRLLFILDLLWLAALSVFVFAGMNLVPFHGDEAGHIYTSRDFHTALIEGQPDALLVNPPFTIDSESRVRLLNGSVMRYTVGLAWSLVGLTINDLNAAPGWDWGLDYATNVETNHRPSPQLLTIARTVACIYFALSIVALFLIGRSMVVPPLAWRPTAYIATLVYTLNPVMLLNGRRALVESPFLAFGLLTIWLALEIIRRRSNNEKRMVGWWVGLAIASALCLASKYSGVIFVASAFGGIFVAELWRLWIEGRLRKFHHSPTGRLRTGTENTAVGTRNGASELHKPNDGWQRMSGLTGQLTVTGLTALALLVLISPALWNDPLTRVRDLGTEMTAQVNLVVDILPDAPTTLAQRLEGSLTEPFIRPVQHFEQESWADAAPIQEEIRAYMASPLSGVQAGAFGGAGLMVLVGVGLMIVLWRLWKEWAGTDAKNRVPTGEYVLLLVWLAVTVANLLLNPIPWQRYYLALIPVYAVLIGMAINTFLLGRHSPAMADTEPGPVIMITGAYEFKVEAVTDAKNGVPTKLLLPYVFAYSVSLFLPPFAVKSSLSSLFPSVTPLCLCKASRWDCV